MEIAYQNIDDTTFFETIDETVDQMFSDCEEIGTSDVSICVREVVTYLGLDYDTLPQSDINYIRSHVNTAIRNLPS